MGGIGIDLDVAEGLCGTILARGNDIPEGMSDAFGVVWDCGLKACGLCTLISNLAPSLIVSTSYFFEALTSSSTPLINGPFACLHRFLMRHGKGKALEVLCARTNISLTIICPKYIYNLSIKLATKTALCGSRFHITPSQYQPKPNYSPLKFFPKTQQGFVNLFSIPQLRWITIIIQYACNLWPLVRYCGHPMIQL